MSPRVGTKRHQRARYAVDGVSAKPRDQLDRVPRSAEGPAPCDFPTNEPRVTALRSHSQVRSHLNAGDRPKSSSLNLINQTDVIVTQPGIFLASSKQRNNLSIYTMATQEPSFSATYSSPTNEPFSATKSLPLPAPVPSASAGDEAERKSKYLNSLREAVLDVQEEVNRELTARMEEDKAREAGAVVDEDREEENYGEEVVEEEEE
jgi:hypothetical protein